MTDTATQPVSKEPPVSRDRAFWVGLAVRLFGAFLAVVLVRAVFVTPIDALAVRQACASHGFDAEHPLESSDQQGEFGIFNRFSARCTYGPSDFVEGEDQRLGFSVTLDEIDAGGFYTASKYLGLFLQIGTVAAYGRVIAPPFYRKYKSVLPF